MTSSHYLGERISYDDALCTVRYIGEVTGATGSWLGVEWDDGTRGRHDGSHKGTRYFTCVSQSPTAASFVRPTRPADAPRSFVAALRAKYVDDATETGGGVGANPSPITFAGKVVEEVGFDKVRRQLARLDELKVAVLDGARVACARSHDEQAVARVSPKLNHVDLSRNLFETIGPVVEICRDLPALKKLAINGNRFQDVSIDSSLNDPNTAFPLVTELGIGDNMLKWEEICRITASFPRLTTLAAGANYLSLLPAVDYGPLTTNLTSLNLEYNSFTAFSDLGSLTSLTSLRSLHLKGNNIRSLSAADTACPVFPKYLQYIDVSYNQIEGWDFIDNLTKCLPGLTALRISHNPVYDGDGGGGARKPSDAPFAATADEAHMLTIARVGPQLASLNFSPITTNDRNNAELLYLSRIARQLATVPVAAERTVLDQHPRWAALCDVHGAPDVIRAQAVNPAFLQARLVTLALRCAGQEKARTARIPQSFDIYAAKAVVARLFGFSPLKTRLVWETGEWDPVAARDEEDGDSDISDDNEDDATGPQPSPEGEELASSQPGKWVKREVELRDGPRQLGYWIDGLDAKVRVELV